MPARRNKPRSGDIASYHDAGQYLGYVRAVATRREGVKLKPYAWPDGSFSVPHAYESKEIANSHDNQSDPGIGA